MRIGELAARTGASVRSIRYYEKQGLVVSARTPTGQRTYSEQAVDRIVLIRRLFAAGLSSSTMADLLPCITDPTARTPYLAARLGDERKRILMQAEQLRQTARTLELVIAELDEPMSSVHGRRPTN